MQVKSKLGPQKALYLATSGGVQLGEPVSRQPYQYATAGSAALKVDVAPVETPAPKAEVKSDKGYPKRPSGVSDQHLYDAWLLMRTPVGSVAGSKVSTPEGNVLRRVPHEKSYRHRPKAYAIGDVVNLESAYVISLQDYMSRINKAAESRYKQGKNLNSNVEIHYNKKAMQWVQEVHAYHTSIASDVVKSIAATVEATHSKVPLKSVVELRRLERVDEPDKETLALIENAAPVVAPPAVTVKVTDNASVSANDHDFVGPRLVQGTVNFVDDIPIHAYNDWKSVQTFYHIERRKEIQAAFDHHDRYLELQQAFDQHVGYPAVREQATLSGLSIAKFSRSKLSFKQVALYQRGQRSKFSAGFVRKIREQARQWLDISGYSVHSAANERWLKYRYKLAALSRKNNPPVAYEYKGISIKDWINLYANGSNLPGTNTHVELVPTAAPKAAVLPNGFVALDQKSIDNALVSLASRIEESYKSAKTSLNLVYENAKAYLFGKTVYHLNPAGIFVPAHLGEAAPLPLLA